MAVTRKSREMNAMGSEFKAGTPAALAEGHSGFGTAAARILRRLFETYGDDEKRMTFKDITGAYNQLAWRQGAKFLSEKDVREAFGGFRAEWNRDPPVWTEARRRTAIDMDKRGKTPDEIVDAVNRRFPHLKRVGRNELKEALPMMPKAMREKQEWALAEENLLSRLRRQNPEADLEKLAELFNRDVGPNGGQITSADIRRLYEQKRAAPRERPEGGYGRYVWVNDSPIMDRLLELARNDAGYEEISKTLNTEFGTGFTARAIYEAMWKKGINYRGRPEPVLDPESPRKTERKRTGRREPRLGLERLKDLMNDDGPASEARPSRVLPFDSMGDDE